MLQVWQIAAGEKDRSYIDLFLNYDVMFMGPGRFGNYYDHKSEYEFFGRGIATQLRQFCTEVKDNDIILLRFGAQAKAIGLIKPAKPTAVRGYLWESAFDDVFGWDLQHARRVVWQHHLTDKLQKIQKKKGLFYYRGSTFSKVHKQLENQLRDLFKQCKPRELKPLPSLPKPLTLEELGTQLFSKGLPNEDVDKFILAIQRQRRLVKWYKENGKQCKRPSEHEVVAHMILPLLLALGWSEQLLAVEWRKVDLAAFGCTPTVPTNCCLVCEAKGYEHGLQNIFTQATTYVKKLGLDNCKKILLTEGTRLYLYKRKENNDWDNVPIGYLNIDFIRTNHIIPANTNAVDTIMALTPAGINRT